MAYARDHAANGTPDSEAAQRLRPAIAALEQHTALARELRGAQTAKRGAASALASSAPAPNDDESPPGDGSASDLVARAEGAFEMVVLAAEALLKVDPVQAARFAGPWARQAADNARSTPPPAHNGQAVRQPVAPALFAVDPTDADWGAAQASVRSTSTASPNERVTTEADWQLQRLEAYV